MSAAGDYDAEMIRRSHLDDQTIERLLNGDVVAGQELLRSFVEDTQLATSSPGTPPSDALAAFFADDFSPEKGDLLATAASNVPGPAPQVAGLPKRRMNMIELVLAKLAALGLAAKVTAATGAVALAGTGVAFTGALPPAAQNRVADAFDRAGVNIPGGTSDEEGGEAEEEEADISTAETEEEGNVEGTEVEDVPEVDEEVELGDAPEQAEFGTNVSDRARSGAPQEDGAQFGEDVSTSARETHKPATPTRESKPGTERRPEATPTTEENAGSTRPVTTTPTADSNPGAQQRPVPAPTAESNPGTEYQPDPMPSPETADAQPAPAGGSETGASRRP